MLVRISPCLLFIPEYFSALSFFSLLYFHYLAMEEASFKSGELQLPSQEVRCSVLQTSLPTALWIRGLITVALVISGSDLWSNGMEKILTSGVFHFFKHSITDKYNT